MTQVRDTSGNEKAETAGGAKGCLGNDKAVGREDTGREGGAAPDILERTAAFADRIVRVCLSLPNNTVGWALGKQLVRAGTSVGANVEEAQAGESKADFIHKMKIARKECREARYFLTRLANAQLIAPSRLEEITDEAEQLLRILTAIILKMEKQGR